MIYSIASQLPVVILLAFIPQYNLKKPLSKYNLSVKQPTI